MSLDIKKIIGEFLLVLLFTITFYINKHIHSTQQVPNSFTTKTNINKLNIPDLPPKHYQFWLKNNLRALEEYKQICNKFINNNNNNLENFKQLHVNLTFDNENYLNNLEYGNSVLEIICSKIKVVTKSCWGYENNCQIIHAMPDCQGPKSSLGEAKSEQEQKIAWFSQGDFGYILDRRKELARFCSPDKYSNDSVKSSLECTKYFKNCRANNLFIKFKNNFPKTESLILEKKEKQNIISKIGGWNCDLQLKRIQEENGQQGILQSWFNELQAYNLIQNEPQPVELIDNVNSSLSKELAKQSGCDLTIDKQAFILKLDSPFNMYHYFCNFLNLYATFHLNNRFSIDNQIIIWDYQLPKGKFELMWSVFTKNKLLSIKEFENKRVCFKKVIFSLLPRMIDGLYYNTKLIPGCSKSGLFNAFNKHVLYKLNIKQNYNIEKHREIDNKLIRITLISRSTLHRKIVNEEEIKIFMLNNFNVINNNDNRFQDSNLIEFDIVDYSKLNFNEQLLRSQNTDILIGIHGAGLTNLLFLPDWASIIELNNCNDKAYYDLARLRGINYFTSIDDKLSQKVPIDNENELKKLTKSNLDKHEKFSNYRINIEEYSKLLYKSIERVKKNRMKYFENLESELKTTTTTKKLQIDINKSERDTKKESQHIEL